MVAKLYNVLQTCKYDTNYIHVLTSQISLHRMLFAIISTDSRTYLSWNEYVTSQYMYCVQRCYIA